MSAIHIFVYLYIHAFMQIGQKQHIYLQFGNHSVYNIKMFVKNGFYRRDAMLAWVFSTSTRLSVRLSVTCRYCVKTKKASVMISSPSGSHTILVFWGQISSQNSKGFPERGPQRRVGWENSVIF